MNKNKIAWKDRFFTPDEIAQMEAIFNEHFFENLKKDENIFFEGYYEDGVCYATLTLKNHDESFYYPVETSISLKENPELDEKMARAALLNFIGEYFEDYFEENRETYITIDWAPYKAEGLTIYARGQVLNKKLENMGDDILKSAGFAPDGAPVKKKK